MPPPAASPQTPALLDAGELRLIDAWWRQVHNGFSHRDPGFIDRVPRLQTRAAHREERMKNEIIPNLHYAREHGTDRPELTDWVWPF